MTSALTESAARQWVCLLACVAAAVSSLEWLLPPAKLARFNLLAPGSVELSHGTLGQLEGWWRPAGLRCILTLRFVFATYFVLCVALGSAPETAGWAVLLAGLCCLVLRYQDPIGIHVGMDGAEQIMTACLLTLGVSFTLNSPLALRAALVFVAFQALLEYFGAGCTKLLDWRGWARGTHLQLVVASSSYGHPWFAQRALQYPLISGALSLGVIAIEVAAPLALVLPAPYAELLLGSILLFHLGSAVVMGLNTFVWGFAATYPAILICRDLLLAAL